MKQPKYGWTEQTLTETDTETLFTVQSLSLSRTTQTDNTRMYEVYEY